jgi:hypothetical protein
MFNPEARWDRSMPADSEDNSQAVEVFARFSKGKVTPLYFVLNGRRTQVSRINYSWAERKGKTLLRYFSVSDVSDTYILVLNTETMSWRISTSF